MGEVAITYKLMPEGPDVNLENMKASIQSRIGGMVNRLNIEEKPIAFGLKALYVTVTFPDKAGISDELEEKLENIAEVQSVNTESMGLL